MSLGSAGQRGARQHQMPSTCASVPSTPAFTSQTTLKHVRKWRLSQQMPPGTCSAGQYALRLRAWRVLVHATSVRPTGHAALTGHAAALTGHCSMHFVEEWLRCRRVAPAPPLAQCHPWRATHSCHSSSGVIDPLSSAHITAVSLILTISYRM